MKIHNKFRILITVACLTAGPALAVDATSADEFFELTLGELLNLEVTSVSKRPQRVSEAAAAVFVITNEDIRRSGVTSIPEALRMVPGVQVAKVDANKWAVTARGFNNRFANKLLVMMDGRSLYTPLFSGVFWNQHDTVLEDIERIEVIRGPGATLWGANAVNGVINIITKSSADTQGGLFTVGAGNEERGFTNFRHGGVVGDIGHYRIFAKYFDRDGSVDLATGDDNADDWQQWQIGFRTDLSLGNRDDLTVQGDFSRSSNGETVTLPSLAPPYRVPVDRDEDVTAFNLLARWDRQVSPSQQFIVQSYVDFADRNWDFFGEERLTFDIDLQYRTQQIERHDLLLGLGYRWTRSDTDPSQFLSVVPDERSDDLFSAFVQDNYAFVPDRWSLIVGSKFEYNDYTGFEYQPNARILWTPDEKHSFWGSVTRAVRTPGQADHDNRGWISVVPPLTADNPAPLPLKIYSQGNENNESEVVMAYEAGFKFQPSPSFGLDVALYYNEYDNLRSGSTGEAFCEPDGIPPACLFAPATTNLAIETRLGDEASGRSHGVEVAADWRPFPRWRLQAGYTYMDLDMDVEDGSQFEDIPGRNPRHQVSLRSWFNPRDDVDLDLWVRYVDEVSNFYLTTPIEIDAYVALDARIAWRPSKRTELSLVGRNVLDGAHPEYFSELGDIPLTEVERSFYLQWRMEY